MRPEDCNSELSATTRPTMAEDCVNDNIKTSSKLFLSCTVYDARGQKNPHSFVLPSLILEQLLVHTVQSFRFSLIFSSPSPSSSSKKMHYTSFLALVAVPGALAFPWGLAPRKSKANTASTDVTLYAYGTNISGLPVLYGSSDGMNSAFNHTVSPPKFSEMAAMNEPSLSLKNIFPFLKQASSTSPQATPLPRDCSR